MDFFEQRRKPPSGSTVDATYNIPIETLGPTRLKDEKTALTLQAHGTYGNVKPAAFAVWEERDGFLKMPRFYGLERYGIPETDLRTQGEPLQSSEFLGELTAVQREAKAAVFEKHLTLRGGGGSMICLPCGYGKTVLAVHLVCTLARKAIVVVHKGVIKDQWCAAFEKFAPALKVGVVQGGSNWEVEGYDVVIAMVLTLAKRTDVDSALFKSFGTVVVDECHHMAARIMNRAMRWFDAFYIIGLTADKMRADGMTPLLHQILGPESYRTERGGAESVSVSIATYSNTNTRELFGRDGKPLMSVMLNNMAVDVERNAFITQRVVKMHTDGRVILILSDRLKQLHALHAMLLSAGVQPHDLGMFCGSTKEAERNDQLSRKIVLCSYAMANEGVDKREADTCVMATPKGRVVQCIGRIQRPCETKQKPLVLDIADDLSVFCALRWKRQKMYKKEKYEVQVLPCDADSAHWFV